MKLDIEKLTYRKMDIKDLDLFINLRLEFLSDINKEKTEKNKQLIIDSLSEYYKEYLLKNEFIGIVCEYNEKIISTAFLSINVKPANYNFPNGKTGTLLNVFTYPEYRKNGISTKIIQIIIEEAKKLKVSEIELLSTKDGENVYIKSGFNESEMKYMRIKLF